MVLYRNWSGNSIDLEILNFPPISNFIMLCVKNVYGLITEKEKLFSYLKSICAWTSTWEKEGVCWCSGSAEARLPDSHDRRFARKPQWAFKQAWMFLPGRPPSSQKTSRHSRLELNRNCWCVILEEVLIFYGKRFVCSVLISPCKALVANWSGSKHKKHLKNSHWWLYCREKKKTTSDLWWSQKCWSLRKLANLHINLCGKKYI